MFEDSLLSHEELLAEILAEIYWAIGWSTARVRAELKFKAVQFSFYRLLSQPQRNISINTGGGTYRKIYNWGYYAERDIIITLQVIASSSRSNSEKTLLRQVGTEIAQRLKWSLHNQIFINLDKTDQAKQVKRTWDSKVKLGSNVSEKLLSNTTILEVFEGSDIQGSLLILGKPGSGKTTTMLDLARELLKRSQNPEEPIPVLVDLSSWAIKQQSIPEWLVEELKTNYGGSRDDYKQWLQKKKLLVLLDGLDEVRNDCQQACIDALNQWISGNSGDSSPGKFVVCSRIEEYEQLNTQLLMHGAICLSQLSDQQIEEYFKSVKKVHLWHLVGHNQTLKDLVRAPLFLSMLVIAEQRAPSEFQNLQETDDAESLLIDIYIGERLKRVKNYSPRQTRLWLVWLAKQMKREQQTEFLVEKLQPRWLRSKKLMSLYSLHKLYISLITWVIVGLFICWMFIMFFTAVIYGLMFGFGLTIIMFVVLFFNHQRENIYIYMYIDDIELSDKIKINWPWINLLDFKNPQTRSNLSYILFSAMISAGIFVVLNGPRYGLYGLLCGGIGALMWLMMWELLFNLRVRRYEIDKISINQGLWGSFRSGLIGWLTGGLVGLFCSLPSGLYLAAGNLFYIITVLVFGLAFGMRFGHEDCIKHFVLRRLLYKNGFAPWNYARFLVSCSDCLLLQQVGGRFRFIHKTVQEHFAAMEFERP